MEEQIARDRIDASNRAAGDLVAVLEKQGTKYWRAWVPRTVVLRGRTLEYYQLGKRVAFSEPRHALQLDAGRGARIAKAKIEGKPYAFGVDAGDGTPVWYFNATTASERACWMTALRAAAGAAKRTVTPSPSSSDENAAPAVSAEGKARVRGRGAALGSALGSTRPPLRDLGDPDGLTLLTTMTQAVL